MLGLSAHFPLSLHVRVRLSSVWIDRSSGRSPQYQSCHCRANYRPVLIIAVHGRLNSLWILRSAAGTDSGLRNTLSAGSDSCGFPILWTNTNTVDAMIGQLQGFSLAKRIDPCVCLLSSPGNKQTFRLWQVRACLSSSYPLC